MVLLTVIIRRMIKNKWLTISLLSGLILANALVSSIPIYTNAILQRMLLQDLQHMQLAQHSYPGHYYAKAYVGPTSFWDPGDYAPEQRPTVLRRLDSFMRQDAASGFAVPVDQLVQETATELYTLVPDDPALVEAETRRRVRFAARTDLYDHIRLVDGRLPASEPVDGVYEVLVVERSLSELNMVLGNIFRVEAEGVTRDIKVKPVGVIDKLDHADPYWYAHMAEYSSTFLLDPELFESEFMDARVLPPSNANWLFVLDYTEMDLAGVHAYVETNERINEHLFARFNTFEVGAPALQTIEGYFARESALKNLLWTLNVPVFMMLAYYLYMVSNLNIERQKTEIAVLRSRGAGRLQIVFGYGVEAVMLGAVAFAAGPPAGALLTTILGASNGFLEFVDRSALRVTIVADAYAYAGIAVLGSLVMTLLPAMQATRMSIIGRKQQTARRRSASFWQRSYLDFVFIAVSAYGLYSIDRQRADWLRLGPDIAGMSVDPLLFLIPVLFILGLGMFVLRMYPYILKLIYALGRKHWPNVLYIPLLQVGRSGTQYQFVMVFLIMTIAMGFYSASAARTLNRNIEETISYRNGADIVLQQYWLSNAPRASSAGPPDTGTSTGRIRYVEPPFQPFVELPGVAQATKVFVKEEARFRSGPNNGPVTVMGIHTSQFGRTAWIRNGLLDYHLSAYLNLIAPDPQAVLISRSIADQGVSPGDSVTINWDGANAKTFTVYGIIDYWPTFNPNPVSARGGQDAATAPAPALIVGHLDYMQMALGLEPYEVWIKLEPDAERQPIYDALARQGVQFVSVTDTQEEVRSAMNDPFQLAINGTMTLGFLVSVTICFIGFLLYWLLSLSGRTLQFGVFRALGVSFRQLIGMLTVEQILTSGAAVAIGGLVGGVTGTLFIRLFQLSLDPATQILPFRVTFESLDTIRLYAVVCLMLLSGLVIFGWRLYRLKIYQAVKLGEE